jgi:uncharacterized repeat protein (TIGR03847 family)
MAGSSPHEFGPVDEIDAESIGEPGHRTFRLLAERGPNTASLWLEKEQLQALGMIMEQQLARLSGRRQAEARPLLSLASRFEGHATFNFKVGRMAVGFDERTGTFTLTAHELEDEPTESLPTFTCTATTPQVAALAAKIADVVAAGRPRCPLCGSPIEGAHVCPLANGHVK